jgi:hypothetical protein
LEAIRHGFTETRFREKPGFSFKMASDERCSRFRAHGGVKLRPSKRTASGPEPLTLYPGP